MYRESDLADIFLCPAWCPVSFIISIKITILEPADCVVVNRRCYRIVSFLRLASDSNLAILIAKMNEKWHWQSLRSVYINSQNKAIASSIFSSVIEE